MRCLFVWELCKDDLVPDVPVTLSVLFLVVSVRDARLNACGVVLRFYGIIVHDGYKQGNPPTRILHMFLSTLYICAQLESRSSRFREWCTMNSSLSIEEFFTAYVHVTYYILLCSLVSI